MKISVLLVSFLMLLFSHKGECAESLISKPIEPETKPFGAEGKLSCHVSNKGLAEVIWQKKEGDDVRWISKDQEIVTRNPVAPPGQHKFIVYVQNVTATEAIYTLGVRRLTKGDGGSYTCMLLTPGVHAKDYARETGQLTVQMPSNDQYPPTAKAVNSQVAQAVDRQLEAEMKCIITGNPEPQVIWFKIDGEKREQIQESIRYQVDVIKGGDPQKVETVLKIRHIRLDVMGKYSCMATNELGTAEDVISLSQKV